MLNNEEIRVLITAIGTGIGTGEVVPLALRFGSIKA